MVTTGNVQTRKPSPRLLKARRKRGNGGATEPPKTFRRSGPKVPLAPDGLPRPVRKLTTEEQNIRRLVIDKFDGNYSKLAAALLCHRRTVGKLCEGRQKAVKPQRLQEIARVARTTVEALRAPHPKGIYAGGRWWLPDHQNYGQMARNLLAANSELDEKGFDLHV